MGTTESSESIALAEYLRSQRTLTQAEVMATAEDHGVQYRYNPHARSAPAAH